MSDRKDIVLIEDFKKFCRDKGDQTYNWASLDRCAIAQFCRESGHAYMPVANAMAGKYRMETLAMLRPRTFSALADRIERSQK